MELHTKEHDQPTGENLVRLSPGLYIDDTGASYFYLTGMYPVIAQRLLQNPSLYTPAFLVEVLGELRDSLDPFQMELMD